MQASRRELLDGFIDFVGDQNDGGARATAERLLNRALHTIWMKHPWRQFLMPMPLSIPLMPGQRAYVLPRQFGRILGGRVRNLTQQYDLAPIEPVLLQTAHPEIGTPSEAPGRPELYTVSGTSGVRDLLLGPLPLVVSSSSPADNGTVVVTVEGYGVDGVTWTHAQATLLGTSPVALPPLMPWAFGKAYIGTAPLAALTSSVGDVTLATAGALVLQTLGPAESAVEHQVLTVYPVPNAPDVIAVPYLRAVSKAFADGDPIPNHWQEAVFEEMVIQWRVNTGEMTLDTMNVVRPKFLDLLAFEQANRFEGMARIRPFRG